MTAWAPWQVSVLTVGLAGWQQVEPGPVDWTLLREWAWAQRLTGLLRLTVAAGQVSLTTPQRDELEEIHDLALSQDLRLERLLLRTLGTLAHHGVVPLVSKGPAVAHLDYPSPDLRSFSDVDLFVRSADIDRAHTALSAAGFTRLQPEPRPGFDRRFGKGSTWRDESGLEVDVHRTLVSGPFGIGVDETRLWQQPEHFALGGQSVAALSRPARGLVTAFQLSLDAAHLRAAAARDFLSILDRLDDTVELVAIARSCRAGAVLADSVLRLGHLLGRDVHPELTTWARGYSSDPRDRRWLRAYKQPDVTYVDLSVLGLSSLPRVRDRVAMGAALAWPRSSYLTGRYSSRGSRWRQAMSHLRKHGSA